MPVSHIKDVRYKGFHPSEKKKIIKDINLLIDKFNEYDEILTSYLYDGSNPYRFSKASDSILNERLGGHRNYLLSSLHEMKFNVVMLNERLSYIRKKEFEKFIDSITQDPKKNIEDIKKEIFKWYANEKKFIEEEKNKLKIAVEETSKFETKKAEAEIKTTQERKRKKSIEKCTALIKQIEKGFLKNTKTAKILTALKELTAVLSNQKGNLTQESLQSLIACFKGNRNWTKVQLSKKNNYPPMPDSDNLTNQVIINLYGMVTDGGTDLMKLIKNYIGVK